MEYAEILIGLRKIIRSINLESKKIQKEFGVSIPQLLALTYLHEKKGGQTNASALKQYLNLNASTVSGIISRLEKKGLIKRVSNAKDKRVIDIRITRSGTILLDKAPTTIQEKITNKLSALPADEVERLTGSVEYLANLLEVDDIDASPLITIGEMQDEV